MKADHYRVDLLSAGVEQLQNVPGGIPPCAWHTGKITVHKDDPRLSELLLRGFDCVEVFSAPASNRDEH